MQGWYPTFLLFKKIGGINSLQVTQFNYLCADF